MTSLPSLRRKIHRAFLILVGAYAVFSVFLVLSVVLASRTTPKLLHKNYDSIAAMVEMTEAWNALKEPDNYPEKTIPDWRGQFEKALRFEEGNITEPGEAEAVQKLRSLWERNKGAPSGGSPADFSEVRRLLRYLLEINERAMFELAQENTKTSRYILLGAIVYFLLTLLLALILIDGLATRLARPLKTIAEILRSRPTLGRRLRLPEPNTLELLILNEELNHLWERVSEAERLNLSELVVEKGKLEALLESVEDALLVVDEDGRVIHTNNQFLKLIGLGAEMVNGQVWTDLPTLNENYIRLRDVLNPNLTESQTADLDLDSAKCNYAARRRKIKREGFRSAATLYLLHDITEKRQRDRLRAELIDLLSHELKTPLQSLGTATEILFSKKDTLSDELRLMVETVSEDVERIRAVANEFVNVTQAQSKVMKLKLGKTPINRVIVDWLKPFKVVAKDRNVQVELEQEGSDLIYANIDTVKFPWVISNLVANAVRFSPRGGKVTVKVTDRNGAAEIQVKDEGPGIPPGDQDRIFDPFFQAKIATADGTRGLFGVGLTIAKEVVEAHDGRIEYYPNEPQGAVFRILLPFPELDLG